ncbi:hypothetical protein NDU88_001743 [Pleurodeles waltl]|uniref:Uncharacterized protein n=1 Tax=Pleurodeles waltl TaxID=8319 RepID=A0AAV7M061_PLEWA|nr:hypothetical protein NDU88_001743 [Pleurodeles waltl]
MSLSYSLSLVPHLELCNDFHASSPIVVTVELKEATLVDYCSCGEVEKVQMEVLELQMPESHPQLKEHKGALLPKVVALETTFKMCLRDFTFSLDVSV